jgi:hypothetical protein
MGSTTSGRRLGAWPRTRNEDGNGSTDRRRTLSMSMQLIIISEVIFCIRSCHHDGNKMNDDIKVMLSAGSTRLPTISRLFPVQPRHPPSFLDESKLSANYRRLFQRLFYV